jgi:hypothetical protein
MVLPPRDNKITQQRTLHLRLQRCMSCGWLAISGHGMSTGTGTANSHNSIVFWSVMPCSSQAAWRFGGIYDCNLKSRKIGSSSVQQLHLSWLLVMFTLWRFFRNGWLSPSLKSKWMLINKVPEVRKKESYPRNRPWRLRGLWDVKDPTLSRHSAHS